MGSTDTTTSGPKVSTYSKVELPFRTLAILNTKAGKTDIDKEWLYDGQFNYQLEDEHPHLICTWMSHETSSITATNILSMAVNISWEDIHLRRGEILGFLELTDIDSNDLRTIKVQG